MEEASEAIEEVDVADLEVVVALQDEAAEVCPYYSISLELDIHGAQGEDCLLID